MPSKQVDHPIMGGLRPNNPIQSTVDLNRTTTKEPSKAELLSPDCLEPVVLAFPAFGCKLKHQLFLGLELVGFQTRTDTICLVKRT